MRACFVSSSRLFPSPENIVLVWPAKAVSLCGERCPWFSVLCHSAARICLEAREFGPRTTQCNEDTLQATTGLGLKLIYIAPINGSVAVIQCGFEWEISRQTRRVWEVHG